MINKEFYSTTKAQLITIWVFGLIGALFSLITAEEEGDPFFGFLVIGILFFIFFYTLGWKANRKNNIPNE